MARRWLRCRLHSCASYLEFALQSVSMVVTRKISNSQGLTSVEVWKVLLADAAGQGASTSLWCYYLQLPHDRVLRLCREDSSSVLCSPLQRACWPCLCRKSDSCGRSRSLHRLTFLGSGRAGSLPWPVVGSGSLGLASRLQQPPTRPAIVRLVLRSFLAPQWMNAPAFLNRNCSWKLGVGLYGLARLWDNPK